MKEILTKIYNTLALIDTHGESTLRMASCLNALEKLIKTQTNETPAE